MEKNWNSRSADMASESVSFEMSLSKNVMSSHSGNEHLRRQAVKVEPETSSLPITQAQSVAIKPEPFYQMQDEELSSWLILLDVSNHLHSPLLGARL